MQAVLLQAKHDSQRVLTFWFCGPHWMTTGSREPLTIWTTKQHTQNNLRVQIHKVQNI